MHSLCTEEVFSPSEKKKKSAPSPLGGRIASSPSFPSKRKKEKRRETPFPFLSEEDQILFAIEGKKSLSLLFHLSHGRSRFEISLFSSSEEGKKREGREPLHHYLFCPS